MAITSKTTEFAIKVSAAFVAVGGLTDFSGLGGGSAAIIDTTDLSSTAKEKIMGTPDEGSISLTFNYLEADAGQVAMEAARTAGATADPSQFQITLVNGTTYSFNGFVTTWGIAGGNDKQVTVTSSVEITGIVAKALADA